MAHSSRVQGLRSNGKDLETAVYTHRKSDGAQRVDLVAVYDVGELSYYQSVKALVDERMTGGAEVHYQGHDVFDLLDCPPPDLSAQEKEVIALQAQLERANCKFVGSGNGWVVQREIWNPYPQGWQLRDVPFRDIIRMIGPHTYLDNLQSMMAKMNNVDPRRMRRLMHAAIRQTASGRQWTLPFDTVLIDYRDEAAVAGAAAATSDVVLVWSSEHTAGQAAHLKGRGFTQVGEKWLRLGRLPGRRQRA